MILKGLSLLCVIICAQGLPYANEDYWRHLYFMKRAYQPNKPVVQQAQPNRPVVIIHGLLGSGDNLLKMTNFIKAKHPGTEVHNLNVLVSYESATHPMWDQVKIFYRVIEGIMKDSPNGINLIGYSQGGLIARGLIEAYDTNVHNFISLSAPQGGQYGDAFMDQIGMTKENAYKNFYTQGYQEKFSVPNYWNDPHHQDLYYKNCNFLPYINNEKPENFNSTYRNNFMKLNKLVLIGGPNDGVISPWQSSQFGEFDENEKVVEFRQRALYKNDLFGLKSMDKANKIVIYEQSNINHGAWHENLEVLEKFVLPWLD